LAAAGFCRFYVDLPEQLTTPGFMEVDLHWWLLVTAEDGGIDL